ncbi:cadherin-like beta sandwich domain-containing protein [Agaribacterium sp. ZY112]|uniref:cadherin-like beta sandwich domain-containing protein n=1 Tax=Agaribacterium sp. ZY112 TaxID=3233574 RepID=UPI0035235FBA
MHRRLSAIVAVVFTSLFLLACEGTKELEGSSTINADYRLKSLSVTGYELSPSFDPDYKGPYTLTESLPLEVESIEITIGETFTKGLRVVASKATTTFPFITNSQDVSPDVPFTMVVDRRGDTGFIIKVLSDDGKQFLEYRLTVNQVSNVSTLGAVNFDDFGSGAVDWDTGDDFDDSVFEYNIDVPFGLCSIGINAYPTNRKASISINETATLAGAFEYVNLAYGENTFQVDVLSEDESSTDSYVFNINRATPTDDELAGFTRLDDLSFFFNSTGAELPLADISAYQRYDDLRFSGSPFATGFYCLASTYAIRVNNDQVAIDLSALPSNPDVVAKIGNLTLNSTGGITGITDLEDMPDGEYTVNDIEVGVPLYKGISLASNEDGDPQVNYVLVFNRLENNWVYANTAAELQAALKNAAPNQAIIVTAPLVGESDEASSGMEGVTFYGTASGTEEEPILLRGIGSAVLSTEQDDATVLQLSGEYWDISGLRLTAGGTAFVADALLNSSLDSLAIDSSGQRGLVLRNGSSNNSISKLSITNIGLDATPNTDSGEAIVLGSNASEWGNVSSANDNNFFADIVVEAPVYGELLDVKEGVSNNRFINFIGTASALTNVAEENAAIIIKGNDTSFSNSALFHGGSNPLEAAVIVKDSSTEGLEEAWGEDNRVFSSYFELGSAETDVVAARDSVSKVLVAENSREEGQEVSYSGAAIDELEHAPYYQLRWTYTYVDEQDQNQTRDLCLVKSTVSEFDGEGVVIGEPKIVASQDCDDVSSVRDEQKWAFKGQSDGSVLLRNVSQLDARVAARTGGLFVSSGESELLGFFVDGETDLDDASFMFWWVRSTSNGEIMLVNKFNTNFGLTMADAGSSLDADLPVGTILANLNVAAQRFTLIELD